MKAKVWSLLPHLHKIQYVWGWIWFVLVSVGWWLLYSEFVVVTGDVLSEFSIIEKARAKMADSWIATTLELAAGGLLWWRITKVFVLHGSPLPWWIEVRQGRKSKGVNGRAATILYIGQSFMLTSSPGGGYLLYAAIFRPHPRSDKLIRSRLE